MYVRAHLEPPVIMEVAAIRRSDADIAVMIPRGRIIPASEVCPWPESPRDEQRALLPAAAALPLATRLPLRLYPRPRPH